MELRVIVSGIQLPSKHLAPVKHDTLDQSLEDRQLHFDVINRAVCIDSLDVQNGKLVIEEILKAKSLIGRIPIRIDTLAPLNGLK